MAEEKSGLVGMSFKIPTNKKEGYVSIDEFNLLLALSGDKSKSVFIHSAILHYAEAIRERIEKQRAEIDERCNKFNELFPPKP